MGFCFLFFCLFFVAFRSFDIMLSMMTMTVTMTMTWTITDSYISNCPYNYHEDNYLNFYLTGNVCFIMFPFSLHLWSSRLCMSMPMAVIPFMSVLMVFVLMAMNVLLFMSMLWVFMVMLIFLFMPTVRYFFLRVPTIMFLLLLVLYLFMRILDMMNF